MAWTVTISRKVRKQITRLPQKAAEALNALVVDIRIHGPVRGNWSNYGKLGPNRHHCHLSRGKPTYVAVWEVKNRRATLVEVIYVGTHERAPY